MKIEKDFKIAAINLCSALGVSLLDAGYVARELYEVYKEGCEEGKLAANPSL